MAETVPLQAQHLVRSNLPDLLEATKKTTHKSTQSTEFIGTLGYWSNFEKEVRQLNLSRKWRPHILTHIPRGDIPSPFYLTREQYACGDEYSVQGRFGQNVGQVMTAVFGTFGMDAGFADYRAAGVAREIGKKIPDYAVVTHEGSLLAVGEVKTPWAHKLDLDIKRELDFRRTLGQIAEYMTWHELKYGFLTTYDMTIFLKLDGLDGKNKLILWHSNPIRDDVEYVEVPPQQAPVPANYHNKVTVRECFLFLGNQVVPSSDAPRRHKVGTKCVRSDYVGEWRKSHATGLSKQQFSYVSDTEGVIPPAHRGIPPVPALPSSGGSKQSPERNDPRNKPQGGRAASQTRELAVHANEQDPRSRSRSRSPLPPRDENGFVLIRFDDRSHHYYFTDDYGRDVIIDLSQTDGRGYRSFELNGQKYRAKIDKGKKKK